MLDKITPLIITFNESPNIARNLNQLTWAKNIVVIDSYSTDDTLEILKSYPQVQIYQRKFDTFADQCNFGLTKITSQWVLSLDADYILSEELIKELKDLPEHSECDSYFVKFKYCIWGHTLRGHLYPPRQVLYQKEKAIYQIDGHGHRVQINGKIGKLSGCIYHDDRKPLNLWFISQSKYAILEANKLLNTEYQKLSFPDKIRRQKILAPLIIFIYCLILKGGILDGWAGWYYAFQRILAEILLSISIIQLELEKK
ncbi:MAG TPA: glycosyltransferase family 2 protein [Allocoleopsis sp.]